MSAQNLQATDRDAVHGLQVDPALRRFVDEEVLAGTEVSPDDLWAGLATAVSELAPRTRRLLARRMELQQAIDAWHRDNGVGASHDDYVNFLGEIGYLADEGEDFTIDTEGVDDEIATIAGPQLVVPVTNARYAINAANARWGSLYDALYGTDVMGDLPPSGGYDQERGERVIAWGRDLLDELFALDGGSYSAATDLQIVEGSLRVTMSDGSEAALVAPAQLAGFSGAPDRPSSVLLRNNGLGVEIVIDPDHPIGSVDQAGIADLMVEAAVSVIMDLEDSVAAVDAEDKVHAYRNWLGLMRGDLTAPVEKDGRSFVRRMAQDKRFLTPDGASVTVPGRALMLIRNVGHLMDTDAVLDPEGRPIPEGILDAMISVAAALHDLGDGASLRNSRTGSVYVVKPKMHGPEEVALTDELFGHVERTLGLEPNTVKIGIMDEERRTSVNLKECVRAAKSRLAFINTGFLDRTGDEIFTSMEAGPMVRKAEMKDQPWIAAYEAGNVDVGLRCGLPGRAQIGKGMWAAPDRMHAMLDEKIGHPMAGANCAWVPSPTAATLHAIHYHRVDVAERQLALRDRPRKPLQELLRIPVDASASWSDQERVDELENNAQGILGYVVRWVDQGIGVSKVPDIHDVALMEDRATCRISSQHMANWLHHGVTTEDEVTEVMQRMAAVVDEQNAGDPAYEPMAPGFDGPAFQAALALVLEGRQQPSGYTEPILHAKRAQRKATGTKESS